MIPLRDDNPARRTPVVTRALVAANLLAFVLLRLQPGGQRAFLGEWALVPARLSAAFGGALPLPEQLATLLSSVFLHAGWFHLLGNLWYLWIFGDNIEDRLGRVRFLLFYLSAGIVAGLLHAALDVGSWTPTIGASGAIAGVLGAYAVAFPRARVLTLVPLVVVFQVVALPALLLLGLWFVFQFLAGAASVGQTGGVAWWAHVGGFVYGCVVMAILQRLRRTTD
jgi:membrane associated rhomboid family serine protease